MIFFFPLDLSSAVWSTLRDSPPFPSLAAYPHSFQDFVCLFVCFSAPLPIKNWNTKGTCDVFFVLVMKSWPVLSADPVVWWCQEGVVLVFCELKVKAEKQTLKNILTVLEEQGLLPLKWPLLVPGETDRHILKPDLNKTVAVNLSSPCEQYLA